MPDLTKPVESTTPDMTKPPGTRSETDARNAAINKKAEAERRAAEGYKDGPPKDASEPDVFTAPGPAEIGLTGDDELAAAHERVRELVRLSEKDNEKVAESKALREAQIRQAKALGMPFNESLALPLYEGDKALAKQLHKQHYVVADIEKRLDFNQPAKLPARS